ncbi:TPA: hypothetical protein ACH3X1_000528 [Trebouxia sp. C0004]
MLQQPKWTRAFVKVSNEAWFAGCPEAPSLLKLRLAKVSSTNLLPVNTIEERNSSLLFYGAAVCSTEQAALRIGQQLIQEEQRSQARAATKKAKKQRQKGKRDSDSISAAVQQQQLHIAQSEEEPEHTQHAQQAQHAQHAVQHTAPQLAQQAQQGHDHRQPCTTACAPLLSASVATKPSSSQASSLKQKQEMTTPADSTTEDADAAFVQQLFCCPITKVSLVDPVVAADGHTYERSAAEWLQTQVTSPVTGAMLPHTRLVPNVIIKGAIASQLKH